MKKKQFTSKQLANLRARGKREIRNLGNAIRKKGASSAHGAAMREQQDEIRKAMEATYLGRRPSGEKREKASQAGESLSRLLGRSGARGRKAATERANRVFMQQLTAERRGGDSALWGGAHDQYRAEQIFMAATQDIWMGAAPQDRFKIIMEALGVERLEDAFNLVLEQNADALHEAHNALPPEEGKKRRNSDPWQAFMTTFYAERDEEGKFLRDEDGAPVYHMVRA